MLNCTMRLGSVYYLESNLDEAERELEKASGLDPTRSGWYYLGLATRDKGNVEEAGRIFESVLKRHPDHAPTYEALGLLLVSARRYDEAETMLSKAVR